MKLLLVLLFVVSCTNRHGVTQGVLVDAAKEGTFFTSCEIDVQYGNESSRIESFASKDEGFCDHISNLIGRKVHVQYHYESISLLTYDNHIIDSLTVNK